ncbi:MAG: peptidoglycan editing factor PgeF [Candidatus Omnitrophota bacterium]|nr:peptidoglycan editing factor PgeF [Candidatus Omnitrophota bacterium]
MIVSVRVSPKASFNRVVEENGKFKVHLSRPAQDGEANAQLVDLLAGHLKVKKYQIKIVKGLKSRDKSVEVSSSSGRVLNPPLQDKRRMRSVFGSNDEKVIAAFSNRVSGNMSLSYGDASASLDNRKKFLAGLGVDHKSLVCAKQIHSGNLACIDKSHRGCGAVSYNDALDACDGFVTAAKDVPLAIFTADCLPVFIYDPKTPAIGLVHAGWRGSLENIAGSAVRLMRQRFNSRSVDIRVGFGPAIRGCCYEVSVDFQAKFRAGVSVKNGRLYMDLVEVNKAQLLGQGIRPENISEDPVCTFCGGEDFFSFRREKDACGRIISVIMLK